MFRKTLAITVGSFEGKPRPTDDVFFRELVLRNAFEEGTPGFIAACEGLKDEANRMAENADDDFSLDLWVRIHNKLDGIRNVLMNCMECGWKDSPEAFDQLDGCVSDGEEELMGLPYHPDWKDYPGK